MSRPLTLDNCYNERFFRLSNYVRVCERGRLKVKKTRDISDASFRLAERIADKKDCSWYGEAFCHGDEVIVSEALRLLVSIFNSV